jgi:aminopeptidase YwaD
VFIAFSGEEHGLVGSHYYVNHLSKQERATIRAMVNLDTLGLAPTEIWLSHADKDLARDLAMLATSMHLPLFQMNVEAVGSSDSESFREKKIPSLTLHSVTPSNFKILHTSRDRLAEIHEDDYYTSYKLINAYVAFLDQAVAAPAAKPQ